MMTNNNHQAMLNAALWYAKHEFPILPIYCIRNGVCSCGANDPEFAGGCKHAGKHPIAELVPNGLKDATIDEKTIRAWFRKYPDVNIATTGFLRVDVDTKFNGHTCLLYRYMQNSKLNTGVFYHCLAVLQTKKPILTNFPKPLDIIFFQLYS